MMDIVAVMAGHKTGSSWLILIGLSKLLKALLLFTVAAGAHRLLQRDVETTVRHWARAVRADPDNRMLHPLLAKVTGLSHRRMEEIALGTMLYGALFATEGIGLLLRKRWAEYLTVTTTAGLLPLEVYELFHHFRWAKVLVLGVNLAIVAYLVAILRRSRAEARRQ
ncbi:MAG: DUF2127 domain-containing protein [Tepidisphaerales bacterium]